MRKNTILSIGAFGLAVAIGASALTAGNLFSLPLSAVAVTADEGGETGDEENVTLLQFTSSTPGNGATVLSTAPVSTIFFCTNMGGDKGISYLTGAKEKEITISKDGVVIQTISVGSDQFKLDDRMTAGFNVYPQPALTDPGKYTVVVPEGIVGGEAFGENGTTVTKNPAYTLTFDIKKAVSYSYTPQPGEVGTTSLNTITITYPEGAVVKVGKGQGTLYYNTQNIAYDEDGNPVSGLSKRGTYTVGCEDNVVTLTLQDGDVKALTKDMKIEWYYATVPAGAWTITYDGESEDSPAYTFGNWSPRAFNAQSFDFYPAPGVQTSSASFKELRLVLGGDLGIANENSTLTLKLLNPKKDLSSATTVMQYEYNAEASNANVAVFTPKAPSSISPNNPDLLMTSTGYVLTLPAGTFRSKSSESVNSVVNIHGYSVKGLEYVPVLSTNPANASSQKSFQKVTFKFEGYVNAGDEEKNLVVKKNSVVVKDVEILKAYNATASYPISKFEQGGDGYRDVTFLCADTQDTSSGVYEVTLPAGAVMNTLYGENGELVHYYNQEYTATILLNPVYPTYTVTPLEYTDSKPNAVKEITEINFTYPENCTITLTPNQNEVRIGSILKKNKATFTTVATLNNRPQFTLEAEGNVLSLKITQNPVREKLASDNLIGLYIPANYYRIEQNGTSLPNAEVRAVFEISEIYPPVLQYNVNGQEVTATSVVALSDITGSTISNAPNCLNLQFAQSCYGFASKSTLPVTLNDAEGNVVATFSGGQDDGVLKNNYSLFLTAAEAAKVPAGTHSYKVNVPAGALLFGNSDSGSAASFTNSQPYSFDLTIQGPEEFDSVMTRSFPEELVAPLSSFNDGAGLAFVEFTYNPSEVALASEATLAGLQFSLSFNDEKVAEWPADAEGFIENMANFGLLDFYLEEVEALKDFDLTSIGTYQLSIPAGLVTKDGNAVLGSIMEFTIEENPAHEVDFTYTLEPEAGAEVESLSSIVLTFPNETGINYTNDPETPVATLASEDGSLVLTCISPKLDFENNALELNFGDENTEWVKGNYVLTVNKGTVSVGDPSFNDEVAGSGNFEGLVADYTLTKGGKEELVSILEYVTYSLPSGPEANPGNASNGLGLIGLGLKTSNFEGVEGGDFIALYYRETPESKPVLLNTLNPANPNEVAVMGSQAFSEEGDLIEFTPVMTLYLLFANDGEGGFSEDEVAKYKKEGYYTLVIPDGSFMAEGQLLKGTEIVYHYQSEIPSEDLEYVLTPSAGAKIATGEEFSLPGISLYFPKAKLVDTKSYPATLKTPDGRTLTKVSPEIVGANGEKMTLNPVNIIWKFTIPSNVWPEGQYVFEVKPGYVYVDMGWADENEGVDGNFKGLTATYIVDSSVGVVLVGIEAADSYNVYTPDGRIVKLNAAPAEMTVLEPGIYIINGKKVKVVK